MGNCWSLLLVLLALRQGEPKKGPTRACEIFQVAGLGPGTDGEFHLVPTHPESFQAPIWAKTGLNLGMFMAKVPWRGGMAWTIRQQTDGIDSSGIVAAYVAADDDEPMPPCQSTGWWRYNGFMYSEEPGRVTVECLVCQVLTVDQTPQQSVVPSPCLGTFTLQKADSETRTYHHATSACQLINGKAEDTFQLKMAGLDHHVENAYRMTVGSHAAIHCTSAGETTGIRFKVVERLNRSLTCMGLSCYSLVSVNEGTVIGASQARLKVWVVLPRDWSQDTALFEVHVRLNGLYEQRTTLDYGALHGLDMDLRQVPGTHFISLSITSASDQGYIRSTERSLTSQIGIEVYEEESIIIQARDSGATARALLSARDSDLRSGTHTRAVLVSSLQVDGAHLNMLNLVKYLPRLSQGQVVADLLDLSCEKDHAMQPLRKVAAQEGLESHIISKCLMFEKETFHQSSKPPWLQVNEYLREATTWEDVPLGLRTGLEPLVEVLKDVKIVWTANDTEGRNLFILDAARLLGVKVRVLDAGSLSKGGSVSHVGAMTDVWAPSHYIALQPVIRNMAAKVTVCAPLIDYDIYTPDAVNHACGGAERHNRENKSKFLYLGRLSPEKGPGIFIRALSLLPEINEAVLAGGGILQPWLEALAEETQVNATFLGSVDPSETACLLRDAYALVVPSLCAESFGMVIAQALMVGTPVITFGLGGSASLIRHMQNGIIVQEVMPRALAAAMGMLWRDANMRERMSREALADGKKMTASAGTQCFLEMYKQGLEDMA
ncbi:unnamed protein product [Chrysoparadoxa australica]